VLRAGLLALALAAAAPATTATARAHGAATAQPTLEYRVELGGRAQHHVDVELTVTGAAAPLELWMPVWTPGAYELRTWGRNVTPLGASDGEGRPLALARTGPSTFRVESAAAQVRVRYRVLAPRLTDDGSHVDGGHALLNGSSIFLAVRGYEAAVHHVQIALPAGWRAATALSEAAGGFQAPSYEALLDAPIECGRFVDGSARAGGRTYRVAVDGPIAPALATRLAGDVARIAETEAGFAGPPPFGKYLALVHLADEPGRIAALEHAASTSILMPRKTLTEHDGYDELVYVVAHELFHTWNARRLRPAELVPYDLLRAQPSRALWITEGLTEYYAHRAMLKAHRWDARAYLTQVSDEASVAASSARHGLSIEDAALLTWQAPDDGGEADAYYARGHLVALALDAALRVASDGRHSLDEALRQLLEDSARAGGVLPVDTATLARAVDALAPGLGAKLTGWVRGGDELAGLAEPLAAIGLKLSVLATPQRTVAGFGATRDSGELLVDSVRPDGPAALAGLKPADHIFGFDGAPPPVRWADAVAARAPGTVLTLNVRRGERVIELRVTLEAHQDVGATLTMTPVTPRQARLRDAFLGR
jgi:predicted metalloprotease with PDZ domain